MAMTATRQETLASTAGAPAVEGADVEAVLGSGDHKTIGRLWIALSSLYLIGAAVLAVLAGIERIDLGSFDLVDDAEMYAQLWSLARESLLFLGVVPLLIGVATYVVPLQVGSSTLAFPRGAAGAFWSWLVSGVLLVVATVVNGGPGGGRQDFTSMWALAYAAVLISLLWALVCVCTTVLGLRASGMTLDRAPISAWSWLVFGTVAFATLPMMVAELALSYVRIRYGDLDSGAARVGLVAVTDTVSLAPGVLWFAIPVLGLLLEIVSAHAGAGLRQHRVAMSLVALFGVLAFGGHVLSFGTLRQLPLDNGVRVVELLLVPLVVLATLGLAADTVRRGRPRLRSPLVAALVSGALLLLATLVVVLAQVEYVLRFIEELFDTSIDVPGWLTVSDTSMHDGVRVLVVGAALVAGIGGLLHWGHKIYGRALDERLGTATVGLVALGTALWGIADVVSGLLNQPREPFATADVKDGVEALNGAGTAGAAILALGLVLLAVNVVMSSLGRRGSVEEPWRGLTLEWATPSPPPAGNFLEPPVVRSVTPLADPAPGEETLR
jgi:cytochrome c oxidase subunit 1